MDEIEPRCGRIADCGSSRIVLPGLHVDRFHAILRVAIAEALPPVASQIAPQLLDGQTYQPHNHVQFIGLLDTLCKRTAQMWKEVLQQMNNAYPA